MVVGAASAAQPLLVGLAAFVIVQRLGELSLARRNERWARSCGAREYGSAHYPLFFLLHGAWWAGWLSESLWRGVELAPAWGVWLVVFACALGLRYWSIASLGRRWNTRILVLDGAALVTKGPYRLLDHPNYCAVALELLALPLVFGAVYTALLASGLNAALLLGVRIPVERRALAAASKASRAPRPSRKTP